MTAASASSPHPALRVACAQVASHLGDIEANLRDHLAVIDAARAAGVQVLLFPEMSLTGHSAGGQAPDLALTLDAEPLRRLAEAAGPMTVIVGAIEEAPGARFFNSAVALRDGRPVFVHRKVALATYGSLDDGKYFAPGRVLDTFSLGAPWQAGVLICNDLWNPAVVHLVAARGATVLFAPVSSAVEAVGAEFDNPGGWALNLRFHALTYGMPVVMCNRVGREGGLSFWGGSRILDPFGHVLAEARGAEADLVVADLDYARLRKARFLLPTVRDANLSLIAREATSLLDADSLPFTPDASRSDR